MQQSAVQFIRCLARGFSYTIILGDTIPVVFGRYFGAENLCADRAIVTVFVKVFFILPLCLCVPAPCPWLSNCTWHENCVTIATIRPTFAFMLHPGVVGSEIFRGSALPRLYRCAQWR